MDFASFFLVWPRFGGHVPHPPMICAHDSDFIQHKAATSGFKYVQLPWYPNLWPWNQGFWLGPALSLMIYKQIKFRCECGLLHSLESINLFDRSVLWQMNKISELDPYHHGSELKETRSGCFILLLRPLWNHFPMPTPPSHEIHFPFGEMKLHREERGIFPAFSDQNQLLLTLRKQFWNLFSHWILKVLYENIINITIILTSTR